MLRDTLEHDPARVVGRGRWHHALVILALGAGALACAGMLASAWAERAELRGKPWNLLALALPALGAGACAAALALRMAQWARGSWRDRSLAPFAALLWIWVAAAVAYVASHAAYERASWRMAAAAAWTAYAALVVLLPWLQRRLPGRALRTAGWALTSLCASVVLAEGSLRALARLRPSPILSRAEMSWDELVARWRARPGSIRLGFPINSRGDYDDELEPRTGGERLVVAIGDSFSLGTVPHARHFTTVCEGLLEETQIYNLGMVAIGPPEYLELLVREALPLEPDLVLVNVFVGNDVVYTPLGARAESGLLRSLLERESVLLWLVPSRLARIAQERSRRGGEAALAEPPGGRGGPRLSVEEVERRLPWLVDPSLESPSFSPEAFLEIERARALAICGGSDSTYDALRRDLLRLRAAAGATPFGVILIPDEFQVEDALWSEVGEASDGVPLERDRPQRVLVPFLEEHAIPVLDLLPPLRAVPPLEDGRRHLYHLRDTHFNTRGNRAAGWALAEFVRGLLGS
ncbi:MAG TPA: hypothetical protein VMS76_05315 [Planctomycetota bacterium]|nr:hypothetical protein [Planctomycetota bacterium]